MVFKALRRETCARICKESSAEHNEMQWTRLYTYIQMLQKHNGIKRVFSAYYVSHYVCRGSEQRLCQAAKLPRWKTQVLAKGQMVDEDEDWVWSFISSFIVIQIDLTSFIIMIFLFLIIYHHDIFIHHQFMFCDHLASYIIILYITSFNFIYHHVTLLITIYHHHIISVFISMMSVFTIYHHVVAWPIVHHLSPII